MLLRKKEINTTKLSDTVQHYKVYYYLTHSCDRKFLRKNNNNLF